MDGLSVRWKSLPAPGVIFMFQFHAFFLMIFIWILHSMDPGLLPERYSQRRMQPFSNVNKQSQRVQDVNVSNLQGYYRVNTCIIQDSEDRKRG